MHTYKLTIVYDGTHYGGWQIQPNCITIQALIIKALSTALRQETYVIGSSRTDAGVHAKGQIAHFHTDILLCPHRLLHSLNGLLPADIRVTHLQEVSSSFHARYSAERKLYHYHLHLDPVTDPFTKLYSWHVPHPVDLALLQDALPLFLGSHDFSSFANESHKGAASHDPIRSLSRLALILEEGGVRLEFEANGFLYKMVRNIVGTLMDLCAHKLTLQEIPRIFHAKDRRCAGRTAPAHGLFLMQIYYH